ncbi:sensor histidine kinase, partial [Mesorhizobium japonicum]
ADLTEAVQQVVTEIRNVHPQRTIRASIGDLQGLPCDRARIAQLLSNLLANAVAHGDPEGDIEVIAQVEHGALMLGVKNQGHIPE